MPEYKVKHGDCISSIADKHGLFWEKIWNHSKNAELKDKRKDPNILHPGDVVFVPDREQKEESCATEQRHRFLMKGIPAKLVLRVMEELPPEEEESSQASAEESGTEQTPPEDSPRANIPYIVEIDGEVNRGTTDDDGMIEISIGPGAKKGRLILEPGTPNETSVPLKLGDLNPLTKISGVKQRLANLGFDCGDQTDTETPSLGAALRAFQEKHDVEVTGEADQATLNKLREVHGS